MNISLTSHYHSLDKFESNLVSDYDVDLDDYTSVLRDICEILAERSIYELEIQVGGVALPVDIRTDLCLLIEQIPDILACLDSREGECILDLYEQGVESSIHFHMNEDGVRLRLSGKYQSEQYNIDYCQIDYFISLTLLRFVMYSSTCSPQLIHSRLLKSWLEHPSVARRLFMSLQ